MDHPYEEFEGTPLWDSLAKAVCELVENDDILERTERVYIVGYLCKCVADATGNGEPQRLE